MKENNEFSVEITQQMLDAYPIKEYKEMEVPVRSGRAKVYLYYPNKANYDYPAVFYLHGGGFVKGHHIRDNYFCQKICHETGALVIDIDYLTAPEHPFPYALNESYDVVKYFMFHREQYGFDSDRTAIIGNSAGGNLAAGIIRLTIENSEPYVISKLVLDWSPLDLFTPHREKAKVWDEQAEKTAQRGAYYNECYVKGHDLKNPLVSPYYTEEYILKKFPRTFVLAAGLDLLCQESLDFAEKLKCAGVDVQVRKMENCRHGFITNLKDDWQIGEQLIFQFLNW